MSSPGLLRAARAAARPRRLLHGADATGFVRGVVGGALRHDAPALPRAPAPSIERAATRWMRAALDGLAAGPSPPPAAADGAEADADGAAAAAAARMGKRVLVVGLEGRPQLSAAAASCASMRRAAGGAPRGGATVWM